MDFMELAKARYSVRKFSDKPLEQEKLDQIIAAGMVAPTAKNQQPQRVYIIKKPELIAKLSELTHCIYGASTVLLVGYEDTEDWQSPMDEGVHSGEWDACIVATHMMLEAAELGVGSCWVGWYPQAKTHEALNLPASVHPVLLLPLGYPADDCKPAGLHYKSKETSAIVTEL